MTTREYPTLTALMEGREPGSVKVRHHTWESADWVRPGRKRDDGYWTCLLASGNCLGMTDTGPWLLIAEDPPALDKTRLEIAAQVLAALHVSADGCHIARDDRCAWAIDEADALLDAAEANPRGKK